TESGDGLSEAVAFQGCEEFLGSLGWVAQTLPLPFDRGANSAGGQVEQVKQKVIGMLRLDVEAGQRFRREVAEIVRHDHFGTGAYGSRQDVAVVGVGQGK